MVYLSTVVLMTVALVLFATHTWRETRNSFFVELDYVNRLLLQTTVSTLQHQASMLRVLGHRLLEVDALNHPERGRALVDELLAINTEMAGFGLSRPDGQLVLVSGVPAHRKLPSLMDREPSRIGVEAAIASNTMVVGRTYYMPLLDRWLIPVRLAVRDGSGEVVALMAAGIDIDASSAMWNAIETKPGMQLSLVRDDGYTQLVLPSDPDLSAARYGTATGAPPVVSTETATPMGAIMRMERMSAYPLTVISSYEPAAFHQRFAARMTMPLLLFAMALIVGALAYRYMRRSQQAFEDNLIHHASHDALTSLPNRMWLESRIQQDVARAQRSGRHVAVMYVDLDQFKRVNDTLGHKLGDCLLRVCGQRLQKALRKGDAIGRMGGDEFLLIFPDLSEAGIARVLAARILEEFDRPFDIEGHELFSNASIGVAVYPDDGKDADTLLKNADTALFLAKDQGRNSFRFFEPRLNKSTTRKIEVENALRSALARNELRVVYQPKAEAGSLRWEGAEALLRWNSEKLGEVSPLEFIPVAEETGMIETLGWFVLHTALHDLHWIRAIVNDFEMSINVSLRQFRNPDFIPRLLERLKASGVPPGMIELEVTESIMAESVAQFEVLRGAGLRLAIDDFGTGFSSLSYLKRLPVTTLKIDREFVRDLEVDTADKALITAIIAVARELELATVAEGIENNGQLQFLQSQGCDQLQGYMLGRPMPIRELLQQLESRVFRNAVSTRPV